MMPGSSSTHVPVAGSSSSTPRSAANPNPQTLTAETTEVKRKLEIVTEELSRNRKKLAKMSGAASRGQMVIEIPDFPMEFYGVAEQARATTSSLISLQQWFEDFHNNPNVQRQPQAYHDWIQTRTVELLPKVLGVLGNNLDEDELTKDYFLSCRLVSKSWRQSIDQFLQKSVPLEPSICTGSKLIDVETHIRSDNYQSVVEMLCSLERNKHSGTLTPFPSGNLVINNSLCKDNQYQLAFNNAVETLLEFHGRSLQSFTYLDYRRKPDFSSMIAKWLKKMPNLRALQINLLFSSRKGENFQIPVFPYFPKLITFVGSHVPVRMTELVLTANPEIRNLKVETHPIQWSKLKQLSIKSLSIDGTLLSQLSALATLEFPLEKLRLTDDYDGDRLNLGEVFYMLRKYGTTLKELHLDLKANDNRDNWSLNLPSLQNLYLGLRTSTPLEKKVSYDFLLPLESLEFLEIHLVREEADQRGIDLFQVIQLNGYFKRLYESNVWNLFPKLKRVEVMGIFGDGYEHFIYTRDKLLERRNGNDY